MQAPILQMLNGPSKPPVVNIGQIKEAIAQIKSMGNPQTVLQSLLQQRNPQLMQIMDYVKQNGNDLKAAFYKMAEEKGINPADLGL